MTIIAWDGKSLAADRHMTSDGLRSECTKIYKNKDMVLAICGTLACGFELLEWYKKGKKKKDWPSFQATDDWTTLVVAHKKKVFYLEGQPNPIEVLEPFYAWGSGRDYALGAMEMGATAKQAVEIASKFNIHCGYGVDVFKL